jgi:hypothetical protein
MEYIKPIPVITERQKLPYTADIIGVPRELFELNGRVDRDLYIKTLISYLKFSRRAAHEAYNHLLEEIALKGELPQIHGEEVWHPEGHQVMSILRESQDSYTIDRHLEDEKNRRDLSGVYLELRINPKILLSEADKYKSKKQAI